MAELAPAELPGCQGEGENRRDRDWAGPGSVRARINQNRAGPAGQPREPSEATGLEHSPGGSPQVRIRMDLLGIFWLSELWVMLGSVM